MRRAVIAGLASALVLVAPAALADDFDVGALVIPMDTTYQDDGMLEAYGLVYDLLRQGVPVDWLIRAGKLKDEQDFVTDATDLETGAVITAHGYRGGPWVIDSAHAAAARPIIAAWQASHTTSVHEATSPFSCSVARHLVVAPTIAMFADGNEDIARGYLLAAGIPDSTLDPDWPDSSPDMLTPAEVAGPTDTNHADGALFDSNGTPVYCQLMSMHWGVNDARDIPEVVAEVRSYLHHPTHFFAECQAVNAYENDLVNGLFLTNAGFLITERPNQVDFYNVDSPFAQLDGPFATVGGSEPSYTLPAGQGYKANGITMITKAGTAEGDRDVWMTGYLDGICPPDTMSCGSIGKVSYLAGHRYDTATPISAHPTTQGTRLFLNSLFEAQCATSAGLPELTLTKEAPATTTVPSLTYTLHYANLGPGIALDAVVHDTIPTGSAFVSASQGGVFANGEVRWQLGNLAVNASGELTFDVTLPATGVYENTATVDYRVGINPFVLTSNTTSTVYGDGDSGVGGAAGAAGAGGAGGAAGAAGAAGSSGSGGSGTAGTGGSGTAGTGGSGNGGSGGTGSSGAAGQAGAGGSGTAGTGGSAGSGGLDAGAGMGGADASPGQPAAPDAASEDSGGCGCRVADSSSRSRAAWLALGLGALFLSRRAAARQRASRR